MVTDAGWLSGLCNRMNGTKKLPHWVTKVKTKTTVRPGIISGMMMLRNDCSQPAPSVQAASSSSTGTESMKFFIIQMANGRDDAAMKRMRAGTESVSSNWLYMVYTGTMTAVMGRPVEKRMP